jgi:3-deoxy-D-manno-octulosonate 8-phosphate phosphatase (KDO 8-P phosphatase)
LAKGLNKIPASVIKRAKLIQVLLMDVDGTITSGAVTLLSQPDGTALEIKTFDAHDGQGLSLAYTAGLRTGVITGRESAALRRRARESAVAFLGDDLPDLPLMRRVGLAAAVGNATPEVKRAAHYVTNAIGGKGAAREIVELILKSKGIWEKMIEKARA